jgi:hypothetical protein
MAAAHCRSLDRIVFAPANIHRLLTRMLFGASLPVRRLFFFMPAARLTSGMQAVPQRQKRTTLAL